MGSCPVGRAFARFRIETTFWAKPLVVVTSAERLACAHFWGGHIVIAAILILGIGALHNSSSSAGANSGSNSGHNLGCHVPTNVSTNKTIVTTKFLLGHGSIQGSNLRGEQRFAIVKLAAMRYAQIPQVASLVRHPPLLPDR